MLFNGDISRCYYFVNKTLCQLNNLYTHNLHPLSSILFPKPLLKRRQKGEPPLGGSIFACACRSGKRNHVGGLQALGTLFDREFHLLALLQATVSIGLDR